MNRLRAYRLIEGINQEQLGERLGVATTTISAFESGRRAVTVTLSPIGYADDRLPLPEMTEPLHRHRASTLISAKNRAQELLRLAGEVFGELRRRTSRAPATTLERVTPPRELDEVEDLAVEARALLQHEENGPIRNLTAAVERAGACLIPMVGLEGIDGLSSWVGDVPVIGLNPAAPGDRFRLTLGHELGHLLFHTRKTQMTETEANRFAGALLFPRHEFDLAMPATPKLSDFVALKSAWGISAAAGVYRAHELGHIDDRRYRALQIQMAKWKRNEPGRFDPVHGALLPKLVEVNGGVRHVAADLGVNAEHLAALVNWSHLRLV